MYLYNEQWDEAADMASQVIGHYGLELCPSLKDLWADDKTNNEFIWTTEFTEDDAFRQANGYWSWYAMYIDRFPGVQTMLKWTGYGGCRRSPRPTSWICSTATPTNAGATCTNGYGTTTTRPTTARPSRSTSGANTSTRRSTSAPTCCRWPSINAWRRPSRSSTATTCSTPTASRRIAWTFIGMTKFYDHTRPGNMSELSDRSYPVIRLGELYLIRAEARIRSTTNQDLKGAAEDITELRKRAVNHEKPEYEEAMKVTEEDMTLDFILEERARELFGEWQRRLDLKRFGRLIDQVRIYNPDAKDNIKEYHVVRPIPQTQFDGMPDWTTLGQNEGY